MGSAGTNGAFGTGAGSGPSSEGDGFASSPGRAGYASSPGGAGFASSPGGAGFASSPGGGNASLSPGFAVGDMLEEEDDDDELEMHSKAFHAIKQLGAIRARTADERKRCVCLPIVLLDFGVVDQMRERWFGRY